MPMDHTGFIVIVFYQILCNGELPLAGLYETVEQVLLRKARGLDINPKTNPYKLLYAFGAHQHNWRKAASYMYSYAVHLRAETGTKDHHYQSLILQERLNALSASINALHLVNPIHAWIEPHLEALQNDVLLPMPRTYVVIEKLEKEYLLTSAENMLSLANVKWTYSAADKHILKLLELLAQKHLYDMTFTVILTFFKGSRMKSEMERVFQAMALEWVMDSKLLELYLDQYKSMHARLPVIVAETLLRMDSQIQLPLWLVQMFENGPTESYQGMTGQESSPASLLRIYIDYGRYMEATSMVLKYMKMFTDVSPDTLIHQKKALSVWFPHTLIERLLCQLEKSISSGHNMEKSGKLKQLLHEALSRYLAMI